VIPGVNHANSSIAFQLRFCSVVWPNGRLGSSRKARNSQISEEDLGRSPQDQAQERLGNDRRGVTSFRRSGSGTRTQAPGNGWLSPMTAEVSVVVVFFRASVNPFCSRLGETFSAALHLSSLFQNHKSTLSHRHTASIFTSCLFKQA